MTSSDWVIRTRSLTKSSGGSALKLLKRRFDLSLHRGDEFPELQAS